jgi:putative ABC transport system permease protein
MSPSEAPPRARAEEAGAGRGDPLRARTLLRPYTLFYLYRRRLRVHAVQECFAGLGIAIAVALVFASTVAQSSIAGASREVVRTVAGPASLQLRARSGQGFDEGMLARVARLPGVRQAAPLLEQTATVQGLGGKHTAIDLAGTDTSLAVLDGLGETLPLAALRPGTIGLSQATARAIGIDGRPQGVPGRGGADDSGAAGGGAAGEARYVTLRMRGTSTRLRVSAVLGQEAVGALAKALVAVMPLGRMQTLTGLNGKVTRIFVEPRPGAQAQVRAELGRLAARRLEVAPADQDVTLLEEALGPSRLASGLFAAIGALLGFLFAFNAMLLTVPERRQAIADLRLTGARRGGIVQMVLFQALALGIAASLIGLLAGYGLSVGVFHQSSAYLAEAFTLGSSTVVSAKAVLLAFCGGVLATCLASALVLLDLRRGRPRDAVYEHEGAAGDTLGPAARRRLFAGSVGLLAGAGLLYAVDPSAAIAATALLALGTVLAVPLVLAGVLALMKMLSERDERLIALPVALASLRTTTLRSLALAATGAVALFGSVALGGSRANLLSGIRSFAHGYVAGADVWVTNPGDNQAVNEIDPTAASSARARIAKVPGVASVNTFEGGFLELKSSPPRRVWVLARTPAANRQVLASEIVRGGPAAASARLSEGGWIVVSEKIAAERKTGVGGLLTLPTPSGDATFRIAALSTNLAWPPGVIFMDPADYGRLWHDPGPTALGIDLRPGTSPTAARAAIARALGATGAAGAGPAGAGQAGANQTGGAVRAGAPSGLEVATASTRAASIDGLTSEGLGQLQEISTLLLAAAIAAMAAALASSLWQRREWLSGLRLAGARPGRLRRVLALEAAMMLGAGCLTGAVAGLYGQVVIDGFLRQVTGFPLASTLSGARPLQVFALVLAAAFLIMAIPVWLASRISPGLALEGE